MMGVGKTTVGKRLADRLSCEFVDVDKLIEKREGYSINQIFKDKSENYFRKVENDLSLRVLKKKNLVISLGGGAFLNSMIRKSVKNSAMSFWLDINILELSRRLAKSKKRPLLFKKDIKSTVNKIYLERKKIYSQSDFRIKCDFLKTDIIVEKILKIYEKSKN